MTGPNTAVIERFYEAFQRRDAETMAACYAADVIFSDPVFGELHGDAARDMWRMLLSRAQEFSLTFSDVSADDHGGHAHWIASYLFSQTGRRVVNRIEAQFVLRDGLIVEHRRAAVARCRSCARFQLLRLEAQSTGNRGGLPCCSSRRAWSSSAMITT